VQCLVLAYAGAEFQEDILTLTTARHVESGDLPWKVSLPAPRTQTTAFRRWFGASKVVDPDGRPLIVYHGTPTHGRESNNRYVRLEQADVEYPQFEVFDTHVGGITDSGWLGRGSYFTEDPDYAFEFGNFILPVYLRITRPFVVHDDCSSSTANQFRFLKSLQHLEGLPEEFRLDLSLPAARHWTDWRGENCSYYYHLSEVLFEDGKREWALISSSDEHRPCGVIDGRGTTPEEAIFRFRYRDRFWGFLSHTVRELGVEVFTELLMRNGHDGVIEYREPYSWETPGLRIREAVVFAPTQIKSSLGNGGEFDPNDPSILR